MHGHYYQPIHRCQEANFVHEVEMFHIHPIDWVYCAFWAAAIVGTGHKDLFQVIADIDRDDQMALAPDTIAT